MYSPSLLPGFSQKVSMVSISPCTGVLLGLITERVNWPRNSIILSVTCLGADSLPEPMISLPDLSVEVIQNQR